MKKFRKSPISIVCYVFAVAFAAYFVAILVSTITTIQQYYAAYQMSPSASEVVTYMFQNGLAPLTAVITTAMAGLIFDEVRKLNPANWVTEEELAEAREARKMAKEAKQIAKGEAAAAAAAAAGEKDHAEEIKPEFAAVVAEEAEDAADTAEAAEETAEAAEPAEEAAAETAEAAEETVGSAAEEVADNAEAAADEEVAEESGDGFWEPVHTEFYAEVADDAEASK